MGKIITTKPNHTAISFEFVFSLNIYAYHITSIMNEDIKASLDISSVFSCELQPLHLIDLKLKRNVL